MGSPRQRQSLRDFERVIARARDLSARRLNAGYAAEARAIDDLYRDAVGIVEGALARYEQTGNYEPVERAIERALIPLVAGMLPIVQRLEQNGIEEGVWLANRLLTLGGVRVNTIDPARLSAIIDIVNRPAFREALEGLVPYYTEQARLIFIRAVQEGLNPRQTVQQIMALFASDVRPSSARLLVDLRRLARTTQIYASRMAQSEIHQRHNVTQWIWSAALDGRTCIMCVMMHGSIHDYATEPYLNEHHNGRCAMVPVTPQWRELGFSGPNARYATGPQWFEGLSTDQQRSILGPTLFEAWRRGEVVLSPETIATTYDNPIFGEMRRRKTNYELLSGG